MRPRRARHADAEIDGLTRKKSGRLHESEQSRPEAGEDEPGCSENDCAKIAAKKRQRFERARSPLTSPSSFGFEFRESATANRSILRVRMRQAASEVEQATTNVAQDVRSHH